MDDFGNFQKNWEIEHTGSMEEIIAKNSRSRKFVEAEFPERDPYETVEESRSRIPIQVSKQHRDEHRDTVGEQISKKVEFRNELFREFKTFKGKYGVKNTRRLAILVFCNILLVKKRMKSAYVIFLELNFIEDDEDDVEFNFYKKVSEEMYNVAKDLVVKYYSKHIGIFIDEKYDRIIFYNKLLVSEDIIKSGFGQKHRTDIQSAILNKISLTRTTVQLGWFTIFADNIEIDSQFFPWENKNEMEDLMSYRIQMYQKILGFSITMEIQRNE